MALVLLFLHNELPILTFECLVWCPTCEKDSCKTTALDSAIGGELYPETVTLRCDERRSLGAAEYTMPPQKVVPYLAVHLHFVKLTLLRHELQPSHHLL